MIVFGAFVRLSNAGLSCPDWPTCYGRAAWPTDANQIGDHAATAIRPVEVEQGLARTAASHARRFARRAGAGAGIAGGAQASPGIAQILIAAAAVGIAIALYMRGQHVAATALAAIGEGLLLVAALRWSNLDLARVSALPRGDRVPGLLGMWTVPGCSSRWW